MSRESSTRKATRRTKKVAGVENSGTWAEVLAGLDAADVQDGFMVKHDVQPAEGRPALDAFFGERDGCGRVNPFLSA